MLTDRTWAEIKLSSICENYKSISEYVKKPIIAVVKADAYGHGALETAKALDSAGVEIFAVACINEAKILRNGGIKKPIIILGVTYEECVPELMEYDLIQSVPSVDYAKVLAEKAPSVPVHIKVDTGMGRLGVKTADEVREIAKLLNVEGIFTHFADSDNEDLSYTISQRDKFLKIIEDSGVKFKYRHAANSAAVIHCKGTLNFDAVRPGLILYGVYPDSRHDNIKLKPAMSVFTRVADVREIKVGESISYGRTFVAEHDMTVAVLPIGYADGLPRALSNKGKFFLNGKTVPIIGRVCMDLCVVDVTDCAAKPGDVAELFGQNITVDSVSDAIDTISYEIITGIAKRVPRVYVE